MVKMNPLDFDSVRIYVNNNIDDFHMRKLASLERLTLPLLLRKNPYLFRAKNIKNANELIVGLLEAFLSSSEEKLFGDFLEGLAVFIAEQTCNGHKSAAQGVDLEFIISENPDLYTDIIEPIGYRAKEHNERFSDGREAVHNRLTAQFVSEYCNNGVIDWVRLVQANSRNLDLTNFLPEN